MHNKALICALLLASTAFFQETLRAQSADPAESVAPSETFDLKFSGGTPEELVSAIEAASGKPLNLIIPNEGRNILIPAFNVKGVTVENLLVSLENNDVSRRQGYSFTRKTPNIWMLFLQRRAEKAEEAEVRPVNISSYLDRYSVDDLTTAIHLAWESTNTQEIEPSIKYHPETQLLIVTGSRTQLDLMSTVLNLLKEQTPSTEALPVARP